MGSGGREGESPARALRWAGPSPRPSLQLPSLPRAASADRPRSLHALPPLPPRSTYTDDGLRAKMAPLVATASELSSDLAYMRELLQASAPLRPSGAGLDWLLRAGQRAACLVAGGAAAGGVSVLLGAAPAVRRHVPPPPPTDRQPTACLQSARAELYLLRSPHTFPTKQYQ